MRRRPSLLRALLVLGRWHLLRGIESILLDLLPAGLVYRWRLRLAHWRQEPWLEEARQASPSGELPRGPANFVRWVARPVALELTPSSDPISVTVIIPFLRPPELLEHVVQLILAQEPTEGIQVVLVNGGPTSPQVRQLLDRLEEDRRVRSIRVPGVFNLSRLRNHGASHAMSRVLVFLESTVEMLEPETLIRLVQTARATGVGAVGARSITPDGRLRHAGLALGLAGLVGRPFRGLRPEQVPNHLDRTDQEVTAVSGACLAVRGDRFREIGGFDEQAFPERHGDLDLCLRLRQHGDRNVLLGTITLRQSRKPDRRPILPHSGRMALLERYGPLLRRDPYRHPALSNASERKPMRIALW